MPKLRIGCPLQGDFSDAAWHSMTIFDPRRLAWSIGIGGILAGSFALAWYRFDAGSLPFGSPSFLEIFSFVAVLVILHEASHLLGFPNTGFDSNTVIGIWPKIASPYVQYVSPMARNQFLLVLLLPVLTLSILPFLLVASGIGSVGHLSWFSVLNCIGAGSDIVIYGKVLSVVPPNTSVMESDGKLYWAPQ